MVSPDEPPRQRLPGLPGRHPPRQPDLLHLHRANGITLVDGVIHPEVVHSIASFWPVKDEIPGFHDVRKLEDRP